MNMNTMNSTNMNMNAYNQQQQQQQHQPNHNIMPLANLSTNLASVLNPRDLNRDPNSAFYPVNNNNNNVIFNQNTNNNSNYIKSKRIAISAEPAQNFFNRSKDSKMPLTEYRKSEA